MCILKKRRNKGDSKNYNSFEKSNCKLEQEIFENPN